MQTKRTEQERKGDLDCCLCGKCKAMSTNAESLCCRKKNEASDEILNGNFLNGNSPYTFSLKISKKVQKKKKNFQKNLQGLFQ